MAHSFRSAASTTARRFSGVIAAAAMAATSAVAPLPAAARDIEGLPPHCAKAGDKVAQYKCGTAFYKQMKTDADARGAAADARSATAKVRSTAADARIATAEDENACLDLIMSDLKANGAKTASMTEPPKKGEACKVAKALKLTAG